MQGAKSCIDVPVQHTPFHPQVHGHEWIGMGNEVVLVAMATIVKVTRPQYPSCYKDPKTHLLAKNYEDRSTKKGLSNRSFSAYVYTLQVYIIT